MARSTPFRLNRSGVLLALISAAFAGQAGASAGRVDFAIGGATLSGQNGQQRPLARGTIINTGDVLRTNNGRVQMRMNDGAYISLQPNTEFGIKGYKFEGKTDGTESAFFSLLKGAMRTVTGLIGRVNRDRYQVATPTATVGIRGTGGLIQILSSGATLVQGTSGIWFLANPAGSIDIQAGVAGVAPVDPTQPPSETTDIPTSGPAPLPPQEEFAQGEERTTDGKSVIVPPTPTGVLASGSGYAAAVAFSTFGSSPGVDSGIGADATFNALGQMTNVAVNGTQYTLNGSHAESGTDGMLAWGRWIGAVDNVGAWCEGSCASNYDSKQGLHYVVGLPTPSLPPSGTANYTLLGATQPTYLDGLNAPGTLTGSLAVDFGALTVGTTLNVAMSDGQNYAVRGDSQITPGTPVFFGSNLGLLTVTGGGCFSGCAVVVKGFFAGPSAERAGLGYHIGDSGNNRDIIGAAAFVKQ